MSIYERYTAKAESVLASALNILNNRPGSRDLDRAAVAVDLAAVYASLADTAQRAEAAVAVSTPAGVEEECPDGIEGCLVDHSGARGGPWQGEELTELEAKARTGGEW